MISLVIFLLFSTAVSVSVGILSLYRGFSFWTGFLWSFFLSPIVGILIVLLRPVRPDVLVQGGVAVPATYSAEPRPLFCLTMIGILFGMILLAVAIL